MTIEEKIEAIYNQIANKELSFGCKVKWFDWNLHKFIELEEFNDTHRNYWYIDLNKDWMLLDVLMSEDFFNETTEIIWHPVMIGDVLDYREIKANNKKREPWKWNWLYWIWDVKTMELNREWKLKRLPIEEQSEEAINYIYNLLTNA